MTQSSLNKVEVIKISSKLSWMDFIIAYQLEGKLPDNQKEAIKLKYWAAKYCLIRGKLYKKSASSPLLKCLKPSDAEYVLLEIHESICGDHQGGKSLALKPMQQGYFWPMQ